MNGASQTSLEGVTVELTAEQVLRLDELRQERNLSRAELLGELIDGAKPRRVRRRRRGDPDAPRVNPWAQVWPGGSK